VYFYPCILVLQKPKYNKEPNEVTQMALLNYFIGQQCNSIINLFVAGLGKMFIVFFITPKSELTGVVIRESGKA